jgi:inorganic phosphate transporter, PiT family
MEIGLILVLILILGAEFVNGWTDAPNAIATVVSTRVLSPFKAIILASFFNLLGVFSGTAVAETIGTGIVNDQVINLTTVGCAMIGLIFWGILCARWGLPTSKSHALIAGLTGAGFATGGFDALVWEGWQKVLLGLVFSTFLGFFGGLLIMTLIYRTFAKVSPSKAHHFFSVMQIFSAAFVAFSHGSNDGQKLMGTFALALLMGGILPSFMIPSWVIFLCAAVMGIGTLAGGWKIMKTMGFRVTHLNPPQGFATEMGAATTIEIASRLGIPLSTTHTINFAIMGVGATRRLSAVRWGVTANIIAAWVLTFPISALIAFFVTKLVYLFYPL